MPQTPANSNQAIDDPQLDETLTELRPIHYPNDILWWPPAPGYIALMTIFFIILTLVIKRLVKKINDYSKTNYKSQALQEIRKIEEELNTLKQQPIGVHKIIYGVVIQKTTMLLKKSAIVKYKNSKSLSGDKWLEFLNQTGKTNEFDSDAGKIITTIAYQSDLNDYTLNDLETKTRKIIELTKKWIKNGL